MSRTIESAALLMLGLLFLAGPHNSYASAPTKRVLILFPYESNVPGFLSYDAGFRSTLTASKDYQFEFYVECMDLTRFPNQRYHDKLMELFREKYASLKIDLIVANLRRSLDFLAEYSLKSLVDVPVIFYDQDIKPIGDPTPTPVAAAITGWLDMEGTLALAIRLHPDVRSVFVVSGASQFDRILEAMTREALRGFGSQLEIRYLSGLSMDELSHRVSILPEHSLIFYVSVFRDGTGKAFKSPEALALISRQANAPIYSVSETYLGSGIVGGHLLIHSAQGARTARAALRLLGGQKPDDPGPPGESGNRYIFDARELRRWGIDQKNLPTGSEVRYGEFSVWATYRWQIIGLGTVLIIQALLISALVVSRGKQRRARECMEVSEEFSRAILASLKNQIAILDRNGNILAVNDAWEQFARQNGAPSLAALGPGADYLEVCRQSVQFLGDSASQALEGIRSVLDGSKDVFSLEYSCNSPAESRWFLMKVMPFKNPAGGVVISHTDITERKNAEIEAQSHREELAHVSRIVTIGELASSLAHEINQPLTAILCNAEAARRFLASTTPDLAEVQKIIEDIIQDDRRAGEVIWRMRTLVKKEPPRRETVLLNDAVRETIALVRNASFLEGLSIVAELDSELPSVQGDRVQLQQVVLNLLLNATAAMRDTPPVARKLIVKTARQDSRAVTVSVRDSGTGIDQNDMDHLFRPFYTTKADGLGMGLSISRTIIKAHGGTIGAENNREGGASFYFTLPLHREEQP